MLTRSRSTLAVGLVLATLAAGCGRTAAGEAAGDQVQVDVLGAVDATEGLDWPRDGDGALREATAVEDAHELEVRFGERTLVTTSQLTFVDQRSEQVVRVAFQPQPELLELDDAVELVEQLLDEAGIRSLTIDDELAAWRTAGVEADDTWPATPELTVRADLGDTELRVQLRERQGEGWFSVLTLARAVDDWPDRA